ncbi:YaaR family protein [Oceanobacillus timonensis]|uniref:YaaR family protein n=1 Tax=Oceanobacillus timonensis TaxID=1926285 RepID=UPI0009B95790|nr:YaaR family protein [Oceanobacillus timonensis]
MKISSDIAAPREGNLQRSTQPNNASSFQKFVQSQSEQLKTQEFTQMVKQIAEQGNKLSRYRSFRELVKFKRMVKGFLEKATSEGYLLEKKHSFGMQGSRQLSTIKVIDEKIAQLAEDVMDEEKKTIDILGLIGEIKGLLINIYT